MERSGCEVGWGTERRISERMACYGVFTGAREFAYRASVTSPLAGFGHSQLGISPGADLRDNGNHSYGKLGVCLPVIRSSLLLIKLHHFLRVSLRQSFQTSSLSFRRRYACAAAVSIIRKSLRVHKRKEELS